MAQDCLGAISKCATRDAWPAQEMTSRRLLPVALLPRPQGPGLGSADQTSFLCASLQRPGAPGSFPGPVSWVGSALLPHPGLACSPWDPAVTYRKSGGSG